MKVLSLKNQNLHSGAPGSLTLTDSRTGLPLIGSSIWISLNEYKYSESTVRKYLFAIGKFYKHVDQVEHERIDLDQMLLSCNVIKLTEHLRSFMAFMQNSRAQTQSNSSGSFRRVVHFVIDTVTEISHRLGKKPKEIQVIYRDLSRLQSLYDFLRPKKNVDIARIRSIPGAVLSEIFKIVDPISKSNPFRTKSIKQRNHLIISLLYFMGLRRGELLSLQVDSFKSEHSDSTDNIHFWLNINSSRLFDSRAETPSLKNEYSIRQLPLPDDLFLACSSYCTNWRGRRPNGFLFCSSNGSPLSQRALGALFETINGRLSKEAVKKLEDTTGKKRISPHSMRHSSAVYRLRAYRESGVEMDQAESLMRAFFGWSDSSSMPRKYARAFYEQQLSEEWCNKFDRLVEGIRNYEP